MDTKAHICFKAGLEQLFSSSVYIRFFVPPLPLYVDSTILVERNLLKSVSSSFTYDQWKNWSEHPLPLPDPSGGDLVTGGIVSVYCHLGCHCCFCF